MQTFLQFAPLIGGAFLLLICLVNIIRNPKISNTNAGLLAFGALLFAVPTFANFTFAALGVTISAQKFGTQIQKNGDQLNAQGADIKLQLADIKQALVAIAKRADVQTPTAVLRTSPAPTILIFYVIDQQTLALKIQNYLLGLGYAANAVQTDFSELSITARAPAGTVRLIYLPKLRSTEQDVLTKLKQQFSSTPWTDSANDSLTSAPMQIQLF